MLYTRTLGGKTRYWSVERAGDTVTTASGTDPAKLKVRAKTLRDEAAAKKHHEKARGKKLREGYLFYRDPAEAKAGEIVLRASRPHSQQHAFFDAHPTRPALLFASERRPTNDGAYLERVDYAAATATELLLDEGDWTRASQTFSHCALWLGDAAHWAVNGRTWRVAEGEASALATYQANAPDAHFNPHCVWPSRDAAYERALIFDAGDVLRVVDAEGGTVFEASVASETHECRSAAISPDGRQVVAYVVSRHIVYGHEDATTDTTHELRIWEVDGGALLHTMAAPCKLAKVGLAPDGLLMAVHEYVEGPYFYDPATGEQVERIADAEALRRCAGWAWSAAGDRLAVGSLPVKVFDAAGGLLATLEDPLPIYAMRPRHLVFSPDGQVLFVGYIGGEVVGFKL